MAEDEERTGKTHHVTAKDGMNFGEGLDVRIRGDEKEIAQSQDSKGRVRIAEVYGDEVRARITGFDPPQGPANEGTVCRQLILFLNQTGGSWSDPEMPDAEYGVDCVATGPEGDIQIQVTAVDPQHWKTVAESTDRSHEWVVDFEAAADVLLASADRKAQLSGRETIVLALDAIHWRVYALPLFVDMFRKRFGQRVREYGFAAVYVVGPALKDVARIDQVSGG